ncbi:protoporphyrinogen oxidase [Pseudonocardiaceae bacterium YIM PH 21723]|nr:protoporphyrinogen oxidase [Pseudonocardiaceae bacterium YIM PH 21723]
MSSTAAPRIAIIGGGVSGLTAAYRLRGLLGPGAQLTVFEQADRLGGKLDTAELAGQPFDLGAEAFLARRPEALALIGELGMTDQLAHPAKAAPRLRAGGRTVGLPARTAMGVPADPDTAAEVLSPVGAERVHKEPLLPGLNWDRSDITVGELLRARMGGEVVERLVDPLLGGVYAGRADQLSLRATMPALAKALDDGARSLTEAARRTLPTSPNPAPVFGTLTGGLSTLIRALSRASGVQIRLGQPVRQLGRLAEGWRVSYGAELFPESGEFDGVVLAVPAPSARRLLTDVSLRAAGLLAGVDLASMAVVGVTLAGDAPLPSASGVLIAEKERRRDGTPFATKAFTFSSRKWDHVGARGVFIRGSIGRYGETAMLQREDSELVAMVLRDLAELTDIDFTPTHTVVRRWGGGLPQYHLNHLSTVDSLEREIGTLPRLEMAGAALHGVGIPACIATATAAAERLAADVRDAR